MTPTTLLFIMRATDLRCTMRPAVSITRWIEFRGHGLFLHQMQPCTPQSETYLPTEGLLPVRRTSPRRMSGLYLMTSLFKGRTSSSSWGELFKIELFQVSPAVIPSNPHICITPSGGLGHCFLSYSRNFRARCTSSTVIIRGPCWNSFCD